MESSWCNIEYYEPWLSIMGCLPENWTEQECYNSWVRWIQDEKYIAVYTNIEQISDILQQFAVFTYHEDFWIAMIPKTKHLDKSGIRLATMEDLPYIESTYHRSGHKQLWNRIAQKQMWVLEAEQDRKGYAGIHKDGSLGFEYVAPQARRQGVASRLQAFLANHMIENDLIPYGMVSVGNDVAKHLQIKFGSQFAEKIFYFYAKGAYEYE
ncbi:MAG: GNAT family N-acetyltransferase [Ruminococcus sp.]|nr:GNAT family N-acetyltransferase [Ruminococcus sp.]